MFRACSPLGWHGSELPAHLTCIPNVLRTHLMEFMQRLPVADTLPSPPALNVAVCNQFTVSQASFTSAVLLDLDNDLLWLALLLRSLTTCMMQLQMHSGLCLAMPVQDAKFNNCYFDLAVSCVRCHLLLP